MHLFSYRALQSRFNLATCFLTLIFAALNISFSLCDTTLSPKHEMIGEDGESPAITTVRQSSNGTGIDENDSIGDKFRKASEEIIQLSPLAWSMILVPVVTICVLIVLICYVCCRKIKQKSHCRYNSNNLINVKENMHLHPSNVKPPPIIASAIAQTVGQQAPIPLTGLANQTQGLKLQPRNNSHHHPVYGNGK